jgi:hypothetical protein
LYFTSDPYGAPKRSVDEVSVNFEDFAHESMSAGFLGSDDPARYLDFLYNSAPFNALRGKDVSSFRRQVGNLAFTIDEDVAKSPRRVLVRGNLSGSISPNDWFAVALDGRIVGLSPLVQRDGKNRLVSFLYPGVADGAYSVFRIVNSATLESVRLTS